MKKMKKMLSAAMGVSMLAAGAADCAAVAENVTAAPEISFDAVENVQGAFRFSQDVMSPSDQIFNIFGTAVTGMCAKPVFETETSKAEFYINVGGDIQQYYTVNLAELKKDETEDRMLCACATGAAAAQAQITGISLSDVLAVAQLKDGVNTVKITGADGYTAAMPLRYALEKNAMIVYGVNGEKVPSGTQLWVPSTVAKYFVRDVVDIQLTAEAEAPEIEQRDDSLRAQVAFMNYVKDSFSLAEEITFEGYADDLGSAIAAVEFSMDGGKTWTSYETAGATSDKWVYWNYSFKPETAGTFKLDVRAVTANGLVSPLASSVVFTVR